MTNDGVQLPAPDHPDAPKYWVLETGGELRPAIERYLCGMAPRGNDLALIRRYLKQWIDSPVWDRAPLDEAGRRQLAERRAEVNTLATTSAIVDYIDSLSEMGMDPL